jgi:hypothetical protein
MAGISDYKAARNQRLGQDLGKAAVSAANDIVPDLFGDGPQTPFALGLQQGAKQEEEQSLLAEAGAWIADNPLPSAVGAVGLFFVAKKLLS